MLDTRIPAAKYPHHIYQSTHATTLLGSHHQLLLQCEMHAEKRYRDLCARFNKIISDDSYLPQHYLGMSNIIEAFG